MLNVFKDEAGIFSSMALTDSINILPVAPSRLGQMGLFTRKPITQPYAVVENKNGVLSLLPTKVRGAPATQAVRGGRKARIFEVPHIPYNDTVQASDVMGVRAFGSEDSTESVAAIVNERLATMKQDHETTHEWHRAGCINGVVLDADGVSVIYDLFDEFGVVEQTENFDFTAGAQDMKVEAQAVIRKIETALNGTPYNHIHALASNTFFDAFIAHETVKGAFETFQEARFSLEQQSKAPFEFAGIVWENYNASVGDQPFIEAGTARFFPVGVPGLFLEINAPANFNETVNTPGKPFYAKQRVLDFDMGVEIHTQSNPLMICTRPSTLVKGF